MTTTNTCKNLYELQLTIDQLPSDHIFDKSVPIAELVASSGMEEYVGLIDHEFNETHIYRRTNFSSLTDLSILKWDGSTIDTTWYNKKDQTYVIQNAEQLVQHRQVGGRGGGGGSNDDDEEDGGNNLLLLHGSIPLSAFGGRGRLPDTGKTRPCLALGTGTTMPTRPRGDLRAARQMARMTQAPPRGLRGRFAGEPVVTA